MGSQLHRANPNRPGLHVGFVAGSFMALNKWLPSLIFFCILNCKVGLIIYPPHSWLGITRGSIWKEHSLFTMFNSVYFFPLNFIFEGAYWQFCIYEQYLWNNFIQNEFFIVFVMRYLMSMSIFINIPIPTLKTVSNSIFHSMSLLIIYLYFPF